MKIVFSFAASLALCAQPVKFDVAAFDRARVIEDADSYLNNIYNNKPITITSGSSPRSAGGWTTSQKATTGGPTPTIRTVPTFSETA